MLSTMTFEVWAICIITLMAFVGWSYEYYKGILKEKRVHKAYKEGYEKGVKDTKIEYSFKEEMKKWKEMI